MAQQLRYSEEELLRSHEFAAPQIEAGRRIHGGFLEDGQYQPPRALVREPALDAWTAALHERGGAWLAADASLLNGIRYPNAAQMKLLLKEGQGLTFWNMLTITGHIEARGRVLATMELPDFADAVVEDISEMAIGHLNGGLLKAHGIDEGGEPEAGIGGHDTMWFALRDLAFGETRFEEPIIPENIGRPEEELGLHPDVSEAHQRLVSFLLNLLLIEFRAELGFQLSETLLRDPELFTDRREEAEHAAEIVGRIRADEEIHVRSLRLYLGEIRSVHFRGKNGVDVAGSELVDAVWAGLVRWATVDRPRLAAAQERELMTKRILDAPDGERILAAFNALEDREAAAA
jgi:hypothetical protein